MNFEDVVTDEIGRSSIQGIVVSSGYYSIFRSTIGPTHHWSDASVIRRPIGPKPQWSDAADEDYKVIIDKKSTTSITEH